MKNNVAFECHEQYQNAQEDIKLYLTNPQVLASINAQPLILYIVVFDQSLGALLA